MGGWVGWWEGFLWLKYKSQKCSNADLVEKIKFLEKITMEAAIRPNVVKQIVKIFLFR